MWDKCWFFFFFLFCFVQHHRKIGSWFMTWNMHTQGFELQYWLTIADSALLCSRFQVKTRFLRTLNFFTLCGLPTFILAVWSEGMKDAILCFSDALNEELQIQQWTLECLGKSSFLPNECFRDLLLYYCSLQHILLDFTVIKHKVSR